MSAKIIFASKTFLPALVSNSISVTNDALANLIGALILLLLVSERKRMNNILPGICLGAGVLTKSNLLVFFPVIMLFFAFKSEGTKDFLIRFLKTFIAALVISLPYFIYNINNYGTIVALNPGVNVSFSMFSDGIFSMYRMVRNFFWSFWAAFGRIYEFQLPKLVYILYFFPVSIAAITGIVKVLKDSLKESKINDFVFLIIIVILFTGSSFFYSSLYEENCSWGKYIFPVLPVVTILFFRGIAALLPKYYRRFALFFLASLILIDIKFLIDFILC